MSDLIANGKLVELTYRVTDKKSGQILNKVEFPISYIHGHNDLLAPKVLTQLEKKTVGDVIDVQIDSDRIFGPRDEELVFTEYLENVPEEFRELGAKISMENKKGEIKNFLVTRLDDKTLTIDGNNPLCGRDVVFTLEVLKVRNATHEEIAAGGKDMDFDQNTLEETFSPNVTAKPFN